MARITWQNVDAPDFSAALRGVASSGQTFTNAMDSFGSIANEIHGRKKDAANNAALEKLLTFQDVGSWDQAMQSGGLGALGIGSNMASDELISAMMARRGALEGDRTSDLDYQQAQYDQGRQVIGDQRSDLNYERSEEDRSRGLEAQRIAQGLVGEGLSREEAMRMARDQGLDPRMEQAVFQAIGGANDVNWSVGPDTRIEDETTAGNLSSLRNTMSGQNRELEFQRNGRRDVLLWDEAQGAYSGYDSPLNGMLERLGAGIVGDEEQAAFGRSRGRSTQIFNSMKARYPGVPETVVAKVMENNLKKMGTWVPFTDSNQDFDTSEIEAQLEQFSTPERRAEVEQASKDFARQGDSIANTSAEIDRLEQEILILRDRGGDPAQIQRRRDRINELAQSFSPNAMGGDVEGFNVGTPRQNPAPESMDRALRESATPSPDADNENIDARVGGLRDTLRGIDSSIGSFVDSTISDAAALAGRVGNYGLGQVAMGVGAVAPEMGSSMLNWTDQNAATLDRMAEEGLIGMREADVAAATAAAPAQSQQRPEDPVIEGLVQQAASMPSDAMQLLAAEGDMAPALVDSAMEALYQLGDPAASPAMREEARARVEVFIAKARENGGSMSPQAQALIERAEEWLGL